MFVTVPAIPQPEAYHEFADQRAFFGIDHFANTVSNLLLAAAGLAGVWWMQRHGAGALLPGDAAPYWVFFAAAVAVAAGSTYYHAAPDTARLVWDRLPMAVAFSGLFAAVLQERTRRPARRWWLPACVVAGLSGTAAWGLSEWAGAGDLRPYLLVQALPLLLAPLAVVLLQGRYDRARDVVGAVVWYVLALVCDRLDHAVWAATGEVVSGHTLKHLLGAVAVLWILRMLRRRNPTGEPLSHARAR